MLVLCRKQGQSIRLPHENVTITIVRLSRGRVRVGISAPKDVVIMRGELTELSSEAASELVASQSVQR